MLRESLDGGRIRGGVLRSHLTWADAQHFEGGRAELCRRVSADTALVLEGPLLEISWYPFRALVEVDRAIASLAGRDERDTSIELGRHSARTNLTASYRFYNKSHPHEFFASVVKMHRQYIDFGTEEYVFRGPSACEIVLSEYRCYAKSYCWSALGYYEQATALQGGQAPRVGERTCVCEGGGACLFEIAWS